MDFKKALRDIVGSERVVDNDLERLCYSRDMSVHTGVPEAIVFAKTTEEISKILALCNREKMPVIPRGSGSSVTGAVIPVGRAVILDLCRMNRIKELAIEDRYAVVEPGVVCNDLNTALAPTAFFPPDPGSSVVATIGGMVALNASGLRAAKYGTTKDHVLALEVVLADGRVMRTGTRAPKTSSGYDFTRLMISSEGTLGVISEITVKVSPMPRFTAIATAYFTDVEDAGRSVSRIMSSGIAISACEIMDRVSLKTVNEAMKLGLPEAEAMLLIEVDGHPVQVREDIEQVVDICRKNKAAQADWSEDPATRLKMWQGRKGLVSSLSLVKPGYRLIDIMEDMGVPVSRIPEAIRKAQEISKRNGIEIATFGHVGDGNLHTAFVIDPRNKAEWDVLYKAAYELVDMAVKMKGTLTAEHGIGLAKAPYIGRELGPERLEFMRKIKAVFDPNNILNPHKLALDDTCKDIYDFFCFSKAVEKPEGKRSLGEKEDHQHIACVQCGFCRAVCPVFEATGLESYNARGRNILAYNLYAGDLKPSKELADRFFSCTTCMSCTTACPSQLKVSEVIQSVRKELAKEKLIPESLTAVVDNIEKSGNPLGMPAAERVETIPKAKRDAILGKKKENAEVLLFMGCMPSYSDMKIVPSTLDILDKAGAGYAMLGSEEGCCGYFAYLAGDPRFEAIASRNRDRLRALKPKVIATPCAGCYRTLKDLYPRLPGGFELKVIHLVELLDQLVEQGKLKLVKPVAARVTYHDPCDLGRHLGFYEPPRKLLKRIPGLELVEMPRNRAMARCCGGGGGLMAHNSGMSQDIAERRIKEALAAKAEILVSACAECKSNLKKGAAEAKRAKLGNLKVMDIVELVAQAAE